MDVFTNRPSLFSLSISLSVYLSFCYVAFHCSSAAGSSASAVLNNRLKTYLENSDILVEERNGFQKRTEHHRAHFQPDNRLEKRLKEGKRYILLLC